MAVHKYCERRVAKALAGYREHGTNRGAAKAAGVAESTLRDWRQRHPDFAQVVREAIDVCVDRDGEDAAALVREHIAACRDGRRVARQVLNPRTGEVVELLEPLRMDSSLVRLALQRWDDRYRKHPPGSGDLSHAEMLEEAIRDANEHHDREEAYSAEMRRRRDAGEVDDEVRAWQASLSFERSRSAWIAQRDAEEQAAEQAARPSSWAA